MIQFATQIELAERGLEQFPVLDGRFVAPERTPLRESFAALIRSGATRSLRLADRLDPHYA